MGLVRTLAVTTHGRYIVDGAGTAGSPLLVGFHGYGEDAEIQFDRLNAIPGAERFLVVSIQGLHRFYSSRTREVVASWMTRQDRELAIADNVAFVNAVVDEVSTERRAADVAVFAGFSQGVAMAFRAACGSTRQDVAVIAVGGDVPPELDAPALGRIRSVFIGRGSGDEFYSADKHASDLARLRAARVVVESFAFDGPHAWTPEFSAAAGPFLDRVVQRPEAPLSRRADCDR